MLKKIVTTFLVFMALYYPPIFNIQGLRILAVLSWLLFFLNIKKLLKCIEWTNFFIIVAAFVLIISYIVLIGDLNSNNTKAAIAGFVYCIVAILPAGIIVAYYANNLQYDFFGFIRIVLDAALIQSFFSLAALLNADLKSTLITWMINGHVFQDTTYTHALVIRMFGYSTGLTFGMPIVQSFLAMISVYLAFCKSYKYIVYTPFLMISAFINSRSSMVVIAICFVIFIIFRKRQVSFYAIVRALVIVIGIMIILINLPKMIKEMSPVTYEWIQKGITEIFEFSEGETSRGYFNYLVDTKRWQIPNGIRLIFGTGIRVLSEPNNNKLQSDIGYVNDLWLGGIVLTFFIYIFWISRILSLYKFSLKKSSDIKSIIRYVCISFLCVYFVVNLKGYIFDLNNYTALFILIISYTNIVRPTKMNRSNLIFLHKGVVS